MSVIPCEVNPELKNKIVELSEVLKTEAHTLGTHGLAELDFYQGGLFRGVIERIRGQFSATMTQKRDFILRVLNFMQDGGHIKEWKSAGDSNRFDYTVTLPDGRISVIELKGCLDGNNTTIFERPSHAQEFVIWSVCENASGDPRKNVWSGIHTRLSTEIIEKEKLVDGLVVWDWICGTMGRPCPKLTRASDRQTTVGPFLLVPPCIYLLPATIPSVRNNPNPEPHALKDVGILQALQNCFGGYDDELSYVRFAVANRGSDLMRTTTVERNGVVVQSSRPTAIQRK